MNRTTTARLIGLGAAVAAITLVSAPAAFATDITNPADNPYPITVVVGGQTYVDGNDTLPGFDDYACTQIPGVNYDFAHNQIDYPDGQVAPWTEWDRIPGYAVWQAQQAKASASPKPTATASSAPSSSPSPSASSASNSSSSNTASGTKSTSTSTPAKSTKGATSTTHKSATSSTSSHSSSSSSTSGSKTSTDSSTSGSSTSNTVEPSSAPEVATTPKAAGATKTHHTAKAAQPSDSPSPSDSQSPAAVVPAGSDPTDPPSADGAIAPVSSVLQRSGSGTGDTSLAGFGILAALVIGGLGVLGADQLRRLGGRRLAKGAR